MAAEQPTHNYKPLSVPTKIAIALILGVGLFMLASMIHLTNNEPWGPTTYISTCDNDIRSCVSHVVNADVVSGKVRNITDRYGWPFNFYLEQSSVSTRDTTTTSKFPSSSIDMISPVSLFDKFTSAQLSDTKSLHGAHTYYIANPYNSNNLSTASAKLSVLIVDILLWVAVPFIILTMFMFLSKAKTNSPSGTI